MWNYWNKYHFFSLIELNLQNVQFASLPMYIYRTNAIVFLRNMHIIESIFRRKLKWAAAVMKLDIGHFYPKK